MGHVVKTSAVLFVTAIITTALLSLAHMLTLEPIAAQTKKTQETAMREVLPEADSFREIPATVSGSIVKVYEGTVNGNAAGYVVELAPEGYSGKIEMMVGISSGSELVSGMRVVKHSETPGLGALAVKESFYRKFDGRKLAPLRVVKASPGEDEVDAITSATITTKAVTDAVNEAIEWYIGGGWR